jgi:hypothetical protein
VPVIAQYLNLWEHFNGVRLVPGVSNGFIWKWSADGGILSLKYLPAVFSWSDLPPGGNNLEVSCPNVVQVHLLVWQFINAVGPLIVYSDRDYRIMGTARYNAQEPEMANHLLLGCVFRRKC